MTLQIGDKVDFKYGNEVCYETLRDYVEDDKLPSEQGEVKSQLIKQGEPVSLLETRDIGCKTGTAARISTKTKGEVWTFLVHLVPAVQ